MTISVFIPFLLILPSLTAVALFSAARNRITHLVAGLGLLVIVIGMIFGWFGAVVYAMVEQALRGSATAVDLPDTKANGIFVSWAASLPFGYIASKQINRFRNGDAASRALTAFVLFFGVHVAAACLLILIRPLFS